MFNIIETLAPVGFPYILTQVVQRWGGVEFAVGFGTFGLGFSLRYRPEKLKAALIYCIPLDFVTP